MEGAIAHNLDSGVIRTSDVASGSISFEQLELKGFILSGLRAHKFQTPTKIQAAAIPMALCGMNLLVQSKSGTGKTLIYVIAALQKWSKVLKKPLVLIIVPTRELAIQVEDTVNGISNFHEKRNICVSFIGGTDVNKDRMRIAKGRIVVGTPGRLLHLVQNKVFDTSGIQLIVLDEADQLYATESLQRDINTLIAPLLPKSQVIACSATYPNALDERLAKLMYQPILVSNSERATVLLGVRQFVYELPTQINSLQDMIAKLAALQNIFAQLPYEQAILFASSQIRADSYCNYLRRSNVECELMSGAVNQTKRLETFQAYRNFQMRTMVATDLMARGVDSSHANLIINLDPPSDLVTYLHRIGRAGRFGSKGIAITFISSPEQCQKLKHMISDFGTGTSVLQFPTVQRVGFNFWDFDSYDFPYFYKTEAHEQGEEELQRIRKRWNSTAGAEQSHVTQAAANDQVKTTVNTTHIKPKDNLNEPEKPAVLTLNRQNDIKAEQVENNKLAVETEAQIVAEAPIKSLEDQSEAVKNSIGAEQTQKSEIIEKQLAVEPNDQTSTEELIKALEDKPQVENNNIEAEQVENNKIAVEIKAPIATEAPIKSLEDQSETISCNIAAEQVEDNMIIAVGTKEQTATEEPIQALKEQTEAVKNNVSELEPNLQLNTTENLAETQPTLMEEQLTTKLPVPETVNLIVKQNLIKVEAKPLTKSNKTDKKDDKNEQKSLDIITKILNQSQPDQNDKAHEVQEAVVDLIEQTPSSEVPAAAPNSINTKTYYLAAPTELSSITLHPLASNTVDDASSIISDSMDNEYDSDASYSSYFTESDTRLIYWHALLQRKLQKRRERLENRRVYFFNWRGCSPVASASLVKKAKSACVQENEFAKLLYQNQKPATELDEDIIVTKQVRKLFTRKKKLCKNKFNNKNCNLFTGKMNSALRVLDKFHNVTQIGKHLSAYMVKKNLSCLELGDWINQLHNSMLYLYYNKPKQARKIPLPKVSSLDNYNRIMAFLKGSEQNAETEEEQPQIKFSVHVNQPLNILPINVEAESNDEDTHSNASGTASSYVNSEEEGSLDPYSSSGFVESPESASSGIETSQHDSMSSMGLESDEYSDGDDEAESNDSSTDSNSNHTITAESETESSETDNDEEEADESSDQTISGNNVGNQLTLAQERWQFLFQMQYQYIANYVNNYMAACRRQE